MTLPSSLILDNWEDGISYNGDIDDLIDAIYEENKLWWAFVEVLEEHLPDLKDKDNLICDLIQAVEEEYGDTCSD